MIKIILFILLTAQSYAMIIPDTVIAEVGDKLNIAIDFEGLEGNCSFRGTIILDNPTMFYPENIEIINGNFDSYSFQKKNDSIYNFDISFAINPDTEVYLTGEALAGNDSISEVKFVDLQINNEEINDDETIIKASSDYGNLIYYVRDRILNYYPNPLRKGDLLNIEFELGYKRSVKFLFYNEAGQLIYKTDEFLINAGKNIIGIDIERELSSGAIYFIMQTDGFDDTGRFIYLK